MFRRNNGNGGIPEMCVGVADLAVQITGSQRETGAGPTGLLYTSAELLNSITLFQLPGGQFNKDEANRANGVTGAEAVGWRKRL